MQTSARLNAKYLLLALLCAAGLSHAKPLAFLDANVQLVPSQPPEVAEQVAATLGAVPGALFGVPLEEPRLLVSSMGRTQVSFPLYLAEPIFDLLAESPDNDIVAAPPATRVARVATGGVIVGDPTRILGGGFRSPHDGFDLILVYVDQPCRLYGTRVIAGKRFQVDVAFDAAGFHWAQIDGDGRVRPAAVTGPVQFELFYEGVPPAAITTAYPQSSRASSVPWSPR